MSYTNYVYHNWYNRLPTYRRKMNKKEDKYSVFKKTKELDEYVRKYVIVNFPKVHNTLRIELENDILKLIKDVFYVYYNVGNLKKKYLVECMVDISMIDYILRTIMDNQIVKCKYILETIRRLTDIKNIIYAWKATADAS